MAITWWSNTFSEKRRLRKILQSALRNVLHKKIESQISHLANNIAMVFKPATKKASKIRLPWVGYLPWHCLTLLCSNKERVANAIYGVTNVIINSGWHPRWGRVSTGLRKEQKRSHTAKFIRKKYFKCYIFGFFNGRSSINLDF